MTRPTKEQLETALVMAASMRDHDQDPFLIAKSLLSEHYRANLLQEVLEIADQYINLGMSDIDHSRLIRAIEKVKKAEDDNKLQHKSGFGLE